MLVHENISERIWAAALEVHKTLGPGLLESAYEHFLVHELVLQGLSVVRQFECPVTYKGAKVDCGFRIDLVVEDKIIIELKAVEKVLPIHEAQLLTYLKLTGMKVGFLINFNSKLIKDGIIRRVL